MLKPNKRNLLPDIKADGISGLSYELDVKALDRWNPSIRASEETDNSISILDPIGGWYDGVTAKRIAGALRAIGGRFDCSRKLR